MKKFAALLLALSVSVSMAGCAKTNESPAGAKESENQSESSAAAGEEGKTWKIAVLLPRVGDQSYYDAVNSGRMVLDEYDNVETTLFEIGEDDSTWESYFIDACEGGYDLIVAGFARVEPYLYEMAKRYPDQMFFNFDYSNPEELPNVFAVNYAMSDLGYIAGALSSQITTSDMPNANPDKKVGVIVGEDSDYMNDFIGGYCQACTEQGVKVYLSYTSSFVDAAKAKEQALAMYNEGVDVIWQVAGGAGLGVFEAAADAGKYAIGVDSDQTVAFAGQPQIAETIVTSMIKDCGKGLIYAAELMFNGEYPAGEIRTLGFPEDAIGVADNEQYKTMVPEEIRTGISGVMAQIKNGEIQPYSVIAEPDRWEEVKNAAIN